MHYIMSTYRPTTRLWNPESTRLESVPLYEEVDAARRAHSSQAEVRKRFMHSQDSVGFITTSGKDTI